MQKWLTKLQAPLLFALGALLALAVSTHRQTENFNPVQYPQAGAVRELQSQVAELTHTLQQLQTTTASKLSESASSRAEFKRELLAIKQQLSYVNRQRTNETRALPDEYEQTLLELQQEAPTENQYASQMNAQFHREARNDSWASRQEDSITDLVGSTPMFESLYLDDIRCRSATCQLRIERRGPAEPHVEQVLLGQLGRELPHAAWREEGKYIELTLSRHALEDGTSQSGLSRAYE